MLSKGLILAWIPLAAAGCMTVPPVKQHEVVFLELDKPPLAEPAKPMPAEPPIMSMMKTEAIAAPSAELTPAERFVQVYRQVGNPRILIYVNRNPEGKLIQSTFKTSPSPSLTRNLALNTGEIEAKLTQAMSFDQQVALIPRDKVFEQLSSGELASLQGGDNAMLSLLRSKLKADVLIQAQPVVYEENAKNPKLLVQAVNVADGVVLSKTSVSIDDKGNYIQEAADDITRGLVKTWTSPR